MYCKLLTSPPLEVFMKACSTWTVVCLYGTSTFVPQTPFWNTLMANPFLSCCWYIGVDTENAAALLSLIDTHLVIITPVLIDGIWIVKLVQSMLT